MASLLIDAGRKRDAIAHLRKIKVELARNRIVHGVLAARAGDLAMADAILQQLIVDARERQSPRPEARVEQLRAEIALARQQASAAHEHAVQAVRTFTSPWTLVTLARAQRRVGADSRRDCDVDVDSRAKRRARDGW